MSDQDPTPDPKPVVDLWSGQFGDTLVGDEENNITMAFGKNLDTMAAAGGMMGVRALIFTHRKREGDNAKTAKTYAMDLTRLEVSNYFAGLGMPPIESDADEGKE